MEDCTRDLYHVSKVACTHGEGIVKFKTPVELHLVPVGGKRIWSEEEQRWLRTENTPTAGVEERLVPELADDIFQGFRDNVLIAGYDKKHSANSHL